MSYENPQSWNDVDAGGNPIDWNNIKGASFWPALEMLGRAVNERVRCFYVFDTEQEASQSNERYNLVPALTLGEPAIGDYYDDWLHKFDTVLDKLIQNSRNHTVSVGIGEEPMAWTISDILTAIGDSEWIVTQGISKDNIPLSVWATQKYKAINLLREGLIEKYYLSMSVQPNRGKREASVNTDDVDAAKADCESNSFTGTDPTYGPNLNIRATKIYAYNSYSGYAKWEEVYVGLPMWAYETVYPKDTDLYLPLYSVEWDDGWIKINGKPENSTDSYSKIKSWTNRANYWNEILDWDALVDDSDYYFRPPNYDGEQLSVSVVFGGSKGYVSVKPTDPNQFQFRNW